MPKNSKKEVVAKTTAKQKFQTFINWLDTHVLAFVALVLLAGLAVKGLMVYLPIMHENTRLVASMLAVAMLLVKVVARKT